ncbi:MAG: hypothetical protein ACLFTH_00730 [Candidatus Woesearchaeota archaeon]
MKTLAIAEEQNSTIVLISHPVSRFYDDQIQDFDFDREQFKHELFEAVEEEIGDEYIYLDYYDIYFDKPRYFRDSDHLTSAASKIFTQRLDVDVHEELENTSTLS